MKFYLVVLIILTAFITVNWSLREAGASQADGDLWKKVSEAENKGLPQTAIENLNLIYKAAIAENRQAEALKALLKRIVLDCNVKGNKAEEKVKYLKEEIEKADERLKPIMRTVLAQWYWHYFSNNRYRFINRAQTAGLNESDFTTWDLAKLFNEISGLYLSVLKSGDALKSIDLSQYSEIVEKGNLDEKLIPTVYDFVCYKALEFYQSGEQAGAAPSDAFELDANSAVFEEYTKFAAYSPETTDTASVKFIAVKIYQDLLKFHAGDADKDAFIDAEIRRLIYVKNNSNGEGKSEIFIKRMEELAAEYKNSKLSALASFYLAEELHNKGDFVKALKIAEDAQAAHPQSDGAHNCSVVAASIKERSYSLNAERAVMSAENSKIALNYKNIDTLNFKVIQDNWQECLKGESDEEGKKTFNWLDDAEAKKMLAKKAVAEWSVALKPTEDYKQSGALVNVPQLNPGFYRVFASYKKDFSYDDNCIQHCVLWVSDLSLVTRTRNGLIEGFVLDAKTGDAIKGAKLKLYTTRESYKLTRYFRKSEILESVSSDENGYFVFNYKRKSDEYRGYMVYAEDGRGSEFFDNGEIYPNERYVQPSYIQTVFFTDRAIYRPGQTIQFKGIVINVDRAFNNYQIVKNQAVTLNFRDVNYQQIAELKVQTNDFGSFSGSFTAPADRATGTMSIEASGLNGSCQVSVEEYKRPKFMVEIKPPEDGYKLDDEVIVTGEAMAYTGAPIDSAAVGYRVVRTVRMPYWWYYWWQSSRYNISTADQEIANGKTKSGADGKFTVKFKAKPDLSVPKHGGPTFDFKVYVDVTDSAGETRSGSGSLRLGYTALEAKLKADTWLTSDKAVDLSVETATLDGKPVAAEGVIEIFELSQPLQPVRKELSSEFNRWWFYQDEKDSDEKAADGSGGITETSDWRQWPLGKTVDKKPFITDGKTSRKIEVKLPPGVYKAVLSTNDRFGNKVKAMLPLMIFDPAVDKFGVKIPEYFVTKSNSTEVGDKFNAFWASGYEKGRVFVEIVSDDKIIKKYWSRPDSTSHLIEVPVIEDYRGGFSVVTTYVKDNRLYSNTTNVSVPWTNKRYDIKFESFRSKLLPGQNETWSIKIKGPGAELKAAEFVAALYDESLDAFAMHFWPGISGAFKTYGCGFSSKYSNYKQDFVLYISGWGTGGSYVYRNYPDFLSELTANLYGYGFPSKSRAMSDDFDGRMGSASVMFEEDNMVMRSEIISEGGMSDREMSKKAKSISETPPSPSAIGGAGRNGGEKDQVPAAMEAPKPDLSKIAARSNLNETAFFYPHLTTDGEGAVKITFTMPEALTKWHFMGFAHGKNLESGLIEEHAVTQKDLMVQPNPPRFIREGDVIEFSVKVTNMTDKDINGDVRFTLSDPVSEKALDEMFMNKTTDQKFVIPAKQSKSFYYPITAPDKVDMVKFKAVAAAGDHSDGEEGVIPILSRRIYVQEAIQLPIRNAGEKKFKFEKLLNSAKSDTIVHKGFTIQMTSNPSWYAIQALPFLMEFPHECSEQTFNRLYANALAKHIADSDAKIRRVFDLWKGTEALKSNLEKNQELKSVMLLESPWVLQAQSETQAKKNVGILFDDNRLKNELKSTYEKLKNMQLADGSWPWFPGGYSNSYITLYIVTGFGRLKNLEVNIVSFDLAIKALRHLDMWLNDIYREILKHKRQNDNNLSSTIALYLYGRSFFLKDQAVAGEAKEALDYFLGQAKKYWLQLDSRMSQGHLALALNRFGDKETAKKIMASIKERSQSNEEMGMFWSELEISWWWQRAPIETQALMVEAFAEITNDKTAVEDCKVWLLKQKQTQDWKTTTATADSIYALICRGENLLASDALVEVNLGSQKVEPEKVEAGTGFYEKRYDGASVKPEFGDITVKKTDVGVAWGGAHWQYMEDMSKITPHTQNPLTLKKSVFVKRDTKAGPVIEPVAGVLEVGDLLTIRIELRTDRDMEYVHMKDQRGSGLEPVNVLSQYKYQDGLRYYESTKDTASHFYIDYLPKGTYVFEYQLRVQHRGRYQNGMAHIECMYAPEFNSHSASVMLEIK